MDVALELVKLTVSAATGAAEITPVDVKVKGTLTVNWLPNATEVGVPYQFVNAVPSGTVTVFEPKLVPVVGVNVNNALVISRGVE